MAVVGRKRLLSDRQALLAFSLVLGGWWLFNGLALFDASSPRDGWLGAGPDEVFQIQPMFAHENGTIQPADGNTTTQRIEWPRDGAARDGDPLLAALGLLQAGGGLALGVYGVFRWSSATAGEWLPPGRYAGGSPDADEEE